MCVAATDPANDKWGYAHTGGASFFASMIFSHGGDILSEDAKTVKFNEEPGIKSLQVIQDLFNSGCTYEVAERYGEQTDFANQKTLFAFGSTAGLPYYKGSIEDAGEFEWSVAPPAHEIPEGVVDVYGPSACVFESKPERQLAAWLFFKYWAETENVTKWATVANYFPLRRSAIESAAMKEYLEGNPKYEKAFGFLPNGRVEPNVAGWQEIRSIMGDAMKRAVEGEDPKTILDAAAAEANAVLAGQ
jgi:ABC-type glycerol-3-phosphate transport system substrate-binding protein